jgi:LPXTG-motif cell wall-anchored protein
MPTSPTRLRRRLAAAVIAALAACTLACGPLITGTAHAADSSDGRDVALDGTASALSTYPNATFDVSHVNDGDPSTRWGSSYEHKSNPVIHYDPTSDWVQIKLDKAYKIDHVVLVWEAAYAASYSIQASNDGTDWTTLKTVTDGKGGTETLQLSTSDAYSYVRMQGIETATAYGYSLWSFEVWNGPKPQPATPTTTGGLVPQPVDQKALDGNPFVLTADARIVAAADAKAVADDLAAVLRRSTGYALPVVEGTARAGDISLMIGEPKTSATSDYARDEAYRLRADTTGLTITAATAHGLYDGIQSALQLLPSWVYGGLQPGVTWSIPATEIADYPRFEQRGLMIDPARNFIPVDDVKKIIDSLAEVKGDRLHIHLTDDQGWRIEIKGWPNLTAHGGTGSTWGGASGFYTQDDFKAIVAYAQAHFIQVIPEIDMPGHSTAAISSYPELDCQNRQIDLITTNATGTVPLCVSKDTTYSFVSDVIGQLAAISPSPYIGIGGDEVQGMTDADYSTFVGKVEKIVEDDGKTPIGWTPIPKASTSSTVYQYWADRANITTKDWFAGDRQVMLSPTNVAYLDYGFAPGQNVGWKYTDHNDREGYDWDPTGVIDETTGKNLTTAYGLQQKNVQGIEGAIWGERMKRGLPDIEYSIWPRLAGLMEKAWSPQSETDDFDAYAPRLAQLGAKWQASGVNFWADPAVAWTVSVAPAAVTQKTTAGFDGTVATIAAPGVSTDDLGVSIDWGDGTAATAASGTGLAPATTGGSTSPGTVSGTNGTVGDVASLFTVTGSHTYTTSGTFDGTLTVTESGHKPFTVAFTANAAAGAVPASTSALDGLASAIADARSLVDETPVGTQSGSVPASAKAALTSAIDAAQSAHDDAAATQAQVDTALSQLRDAVGVFRQAIVGKDPASGDDGTGTIGGSSSHPAGGPDGGRSDAGLLARTGSDSASFGVLGLLLAAGGSILLLRRRRGAR